MEASEVAQEFLNVDISKYLRKYTYAWFCPVCSILGWGCEAELWSGFSSTAPPALDPGLTNLISKSSPMPQLHTSAATYRQYYTYLH